MDKRTKVILLDIFILIFLAFIIIFTASHFFTAEIPSEFNQNTTVVLVTELNNVQKKNIKNINMSDRVYFSENDSFIGTIKDIKLTETAFSLQNAQPKSYYKPELYNITLTIEAQAFYDEQNDTYIFSGNRVKTNDFLNLRVPTFAFEAKVVQLTSISSILNSSEIQNEE